MTSGLQPRRTAVSKFATVASPPIQPTAYDAFGLGDRVDRVLRAVGVHRDRAARTAPPRLPALDQTTRAGHPGCLRRGARDCDRHERERPRRFATRLGST